MPPLLALSTQAVSGITQRSGRTHEHFGHSSGNAFTEQIKATIDARSFGGATRLQNRTAIPIVDISLFPSLQDDTVVDGLVDRMEYELLARKQTDLLVSAYWYLVHPLFPVIRKSQFIHSYNALFPGTTVDTNDRIPRSTFNTILTLPVQLQGFLDPNQRERLSGKHFRRAHALLQVPIWKTASIELIQCLILMSQYIQRTNKPHQTWMVVGSVVRIAQILGLHIPEIWAHYTHEKCAALKRRVCFFCIIMDTCEDWYHTH